MSKDKMKEEIILTADAEYACCPSCGVNQSWDWRHFECIDYNYCDGAYTRCGHCEQMHIFYEGVLIYPRMHSHIKVHELLVHYPQAQKLFNESLAVATASPRAGLALSRMCLEALTNEILQEIGETPNVNFSKNVNTLLEKEIITKKIWQYLDNTRIVGNKSTHNFTLIDTENEIVFDDCQIVWKTINRILDSLKLNQELDNDLSNLVNKVKNTEDN